MCETEIYEVQKYNTHYAYDVRKQVAYKIMKVLASVQ